jgi:CheY-like chemotaxis protein
MDETPPAAPASGAVTAEQLGTLSHEFRTPLNGVLGMARLLEATRLTDEQRAYVSALKQSGDHLLSLVNDVLDFTRLGAGGLDLHMAPVEPETLLRQVAELMSPKAFEKGIEIAWAAAPGLGGFMADEGRLRQVLLNFAGNAIKFTPGMEGTGGVLLLAERGPGDVLRLSVQDTGPGVAPDVRAKIFRPFVQIEASHGSQLGGAGLGLAVVSRLAQAMESTVGVTGAPGGGADFFFEGAFAPVAQRQDGDELFGITVGIASPNPIVRDAAARQVRASGGRAVQAATVDDLLRIAPPEAVLLLDDRLDAPAPVPGRACVVLLAPVERTLIEPRRAAGFAGYLIKPLRRESVAARVLAAMQTGPVTADAAAEDERIAPAVAAGCHVLLAEDNPINAMLARILLEREGAAVDRVTSGGEALAALEAGLYDLVLMDLRMPGLDGLAATRALRAKGVKTPIVALTADAFEDDRRACLAAGMDDFLVKPLTPDTLRAALLRWTAPAQAVKVAV